MRQDRCNRNFHLQGGDFDTMIRKGGQIWIETVLYTLIGIALIGVVLAFVVPKINTQKDKLVVEQTLDALDAVDQKINQVLSAPGNAREINFAMKRGEFHVNSTEDTLYFIVPSLKEPYSEPNADIKIGRLVLRTQEKQGDFDVIIKVAYADNVTYALEDTNRKFDPASIPYRFIVSNEGILNIENGKAVLSIREVGG